VYYKLLPQDYRLRKTKLFIRYSVVSADPAGCPSFEGFAFYLRVAARLVDFSYGKFNCPTRVGAYTG